MLADETPLMTQAQTHIARVANNDALQAKQFVEVDRPAPSLANGPAPALNAILRRMLAFDGKARFRILQQQECSSTREQVGGTFATAPRARSARSRAVKARSASVRKIIGQKD